MDEFYYTFWTHIHICELIHIHGSKNTFLTSSGRLILSGKNALVRSIHPNNPLQDKGVAYHRDFYLLQHKVPQNPSDIVDGIQDPLFSSFLWPRQIFLASSLPFIRLDLPLFYLRNRDVHCRTSFFLRLIIPWNAFTFPIK